MRYARTAIAEGLNPPRRGYPGDIGLDLAVAVDTVIEPGEFAWVPLGIVLDIPTKAVWIRGIPHYWWVEIRVRGSAGKKGAYAALGVVDSAFRPALDEVNGMSAGLRNVGSETITLKRDEYWVQAIYHLSPAPFVREVRPQDIRRDTERGGGKDGSSDRK